MSATSATTLPQLSITRTIHPVGQGAFYSETFFDGENKPKFTAVYDCGGAIDHVRNELKQLMQIDHVDILFISHFHCDHINGVQKLIDDYHPKQVVFPQISPSRFLVDYVLNCYKDKTGISTAFMLKILPMLVHGSNVNTNAKQTTSYIPLEGENQFIPSNCPVWEYITYYKAGNSKEQSVAVELISLLALEGLDCHSYFTAQIYEDIATKLRKDQDLLDKVKKLYARRFTSGHNSYSMLVLSHEIKEGEAEARDENYDCLYTGDAMPDNQMYKVVHIYNPSYIQVPHHGSDHNRDKRKLLYNNSPTAFISVGIKNRYRHPGIMTLTQILKECKIVYLITEDDHTKLKLKKHKII